MPTETVIGRVLSKPLPLITISSPPLDPVAGATLVTAKLTGAVKTPA